MEAINKFIEIQKDEDVDAVAFINTLVCLGTCSSIVVISMIVYLGVYFIR